MTPRVRVHGIDHVVLGSSDLERSLSWYQDVLGLEPVRVEEWRRGEVPFPSVRVSDGTLLDFVAQDPVERINHVCLVVEACDLEALAADADLGASDPLRLFGARGNGWGVFVADPDGHTLELRHYGETPRG